MTETVVQIRDRQEITADDLADMGAYARLGVDHVVADGITDERRYVDLTVTEESSTSVRIAVGRLYDAGAVYAHETETVLSMTAAPVGLPVTNKKLVAIYAYGQAVETASEPRDFLVNPATDEAEPNVVTTREQRVCHMAAKAGTESVNPILPALPDNSCLVATVTISPTGVGTIVMEATTKLDSVESNAARVVSLETFRADVEPTVGALVTEFATLNVRTQGKANELDLVNIRGLIARIDKALSLPASYAEAYTDDFVDDSLIDKTLSAGTYRVGEDGGLMFPHAGQVSAPLALFNPLDPNAYKSATDLVLPTHVDVVTVECPGDVGEQSITEFPVSTLVTKAFTGYTTDTRYGYTPGSSYDTVVQTGTTNKATGYGYNPNGTMYIQSVEVPVFKTVTHQTPGSSYSYTVKTPYTYYKEVPGTVNYSGSMVGQTFLTKRAGWGKALGLYFKQIAAAGDVHVFICGTTGGKPDPLKVVAKTTVPHADLKAWPEETKIALPAHVLESGERIGFIVQSEGAHSLARGEPSFTEGTFFFGTDGDFFQGDIGKDIKFKYYQAAFDKPRTEIILQNVSLSGGISDLYLSTQQPAVAGTDLTYELQIAGIWYPFTELGKLSTVPDIVPLRAVMLGTSDLQPGLQLAADSVIASRAALAEIIVSEPVTLAGAAKQNWVVDLTVVGWVGDADQDIDCDILHGASFATVTADTVRTETAESNGRTRFRFTFDAGAPISTLKVKITGGRNAVEAGVPFRIVERTAIATS